MRFPRLFKRRREAGAKPEAKPAAEAAAFANLIEHPCEIRIDFAKAGAWTFTSGIAREEMQSAKNFLLTTWLSHEDRKRFKIIPCECYTGIIVQRGPDLRGWFLGNALCFNFVSDLIQRQAQNISALRETARQAHEAGGLNLNIYDGRMDRWLIANPRDFPAQDDQIGLFIMKEGRLEPSGYCYNTKYKFITSHGYPRVPGEFYECAVNEALEIERYFTEMAKAGEPE